MGIANQKWISTIIINELLLGQMIKAGTDTYDIMHPATLNVYK